MKNTQKLTKDQELYLKKVLTQLEEGSLPKQTVKAKHCAGITGKRFGRFCYRIFG